MQRELTFFGFHGKVCMMIYIYLFFLSYLGALTLWVAVSFWEGHRFVSAAAGTF